MKQFIIALLLLVSAGEVPAQTIKVTATAYCEKKHRTASGVKVNLNTVAVSRDLINRYKIRWGQKIWIEATREWRTVQDIMHARWRNKIDIWMTSKEKCILWGVKNTNVILSTD